MASLRITLVVLAFLGITMSQTLATRWNIGGQDFWRYGFDYQAWAEGEKFFVGDILQFIYPVGTHNVAIVDHDSFLACKASPQAPILATGYDLVPLMAPGTFNYICTIGDHCSAGKMKLTINVLSRT